MDKSEINTSKYLESKKLLQVYSKYRDNDTFLLGYLLKDIGTYLIFESVDEYGALDGYTLLAKSDISEIITNTNYTNIFDNYIKQQKLNNSYDIFNLTGQYKVLPKESVLDILKFCYQQKKVVMLSSTSYESSRGGKVINIADNYIVLDQTKYYKDWDMAEASIETNERIEIKKILALDIISKDNYLYEQYLNSK